MMRLAETKTHNPVMKFTAYLDESHGKEDVYTVAGYVASLDQWQQFGREVERDAGGRRHHRASQGSI